MLRARQLGISFIEIAIGLAILGISMAWAIPSYSVWMQNTQIRNMAESIVGGLQLARSEAINRNNSVEFVLTNVDPVAGNRDTIAVDSAGKNWMVRVVVDPTINPTAYDFVTGHSSEEGARNATVTTTDDLSAVTYDGLGRIRATNDDGSVPIAQICVGSATLAPGDGARILEINVGTSGQMRVCDPSVADATDPRICRAPGPRCS
jgi:type IV fimbrial biogenesis protein FimT